MCMQFSYKMNEKKHCGARSWRTALLYKFHVLVYHLQLLENEILCSDILLGNFEQIDIYCKLNKIIFS